MRKKDFPSWRDSYAGYEQFFGSGASDRDASERGNLSGDRGRDVFQQLDVYSREPGRQQIQAGMDRYNQNVHGAGVEMARRERSAQLREAAEKFGIDIPEGVDVEAFLEEQFGDNYDPEALFADEFGEEDRPEWLQEWGDWQAPGKLAAGAGVLATGSPLPVAAHAVQNMIYGLIGNLMDARGGLTSEWPAGYTPYPTNLPGDEPPEGGEPPGEGTDPYDTPGDVPDPTDEDNQPDKRYDDPQVPATPTNPFVPPTFNWDDFYNQLAGLVRLTGG